MSGRERRFRTARRLPRLALAALLAAFAGASGAEPPPRADAPRDLVDLAEIAPGVRIDMRYATPDNFLRETVYPCARCLLRRPAAEALARAQRTLASRGLGLRVWDCYRPPSVQRRMWTILPDRRYVADPRTGSVHGRGGAVDVTLADAEGRPLPMPTAFDDFSPRAAADAPAAPDVARNRALLREALEREGFTGIRTEWWHFDIAGSRAWSLLDAPLCPAGGEPARSDRR